MNLALSDTLSPPLPAWTAYIEKTLGFVLPKSQENWLSGAIIRLARDHKMSTAYLYRNLEDPKLSQALIDAVLIKDSRFFRDARLASWLLAAYDTHRQTTDRPFLAMSIGCASGQEVWSAAMVLHHQAQASASDTGFCVVGVDASGRALANARLGRYPAKDKQQVPSNYRFYLQEQPPYISVDKSLKGYTRFVCCNVFLARQMQHCLKEFYGRVDFLICQNMLIYFRKFDQRDLLARFSQLLAPNGYLWLGAGEALFWQPVDLQRVATDSNLWQKLGTL